jgi:hypothetical protein
MEIMFFAAVKQLENLSWRLNSVRAILGLNRTAGRLDHFSTEQVEG